MAKVDTGVSPLEATDFGPGRVARILYSGASLVAFAILMATARVEPPPFDLPLPPMVLAGSVAFIIMLVSSLAGSALSRRHKRKEQSKRDMRAENILAATQRNGAPDFSLYLRAFETTGRMPHEASGQMLQPGFDPRDDVDRLTDVETELAEAVEEHIPLIALGRPGEQVGAGRALSTEERWKEDIAHLGTAAVCIFMFPSARPGTLWEIDCLCEHGFLNKTIFVVPPKKSRLTFLPRNRESYDWGAMWSNLTNIMKEKEIELPDYDSRGQLFTIGSDGHVSTRTMLKGNYTALALRTFIGDQLRAMARSNDATLN